MKTLEDAWRAYSEAFPITLSIYEKLHFCAGVYSVEMNKMRCHKECAEEYQTKIAAEALVFMGEHLDMIAEEEDG